MTPSEIIANYIEEVRRLCEETPPLINATPITKKQIECIKLCLASAPRLAEALSLSLEKLETWLPSDIKDLFLEKIAKILQGEE